MEMWRLTLSHLSLAVSDHEGSTFTELINGCLSVCIDLYVDYDLEVQAEEMNNGVAAAHSSASLSAYCVL